jgi:glutathione S-transferase
LPAALGIVWIVGRFLYMQGYMAAAEKRSMGFAVQGVAVIVLFVGSLIGVIMSLMNGAM